MSPIKQRKSVIEREGLNWVRNVVERANCVFQEIDLRNDFGNDAIIELVDGENVRGICLAVQVKSGNSYCTESTCKIPADKAHFEYWSSHSLTVIGIVYDPNENNAYWTNISKWLKNDRVRVENGPYTLTFDKSEINRFDDAGIQDFFLPFFLKKPVVLEYHRSVEFAYSPSGTKQWLGLRSLLNTYRNQAKTWDVFFDIFSTKKPEEIDDYLIYIISLLPGHGDIFWHKGNILDSELREKQRSRLKKLDRKDIVKLLHYVCDHDISRGTLGQCVESVISLVANKEQFLYGIVTDISIEPSIRYDALTILALYEQSKIIEFLDEISGQDEVGEWAKYLKEHLEKEGFVYFY